MEALDDLFSEMVEGCGPMILIFVAFVLFSVLMAFCEPVQKKVEAEAQAFDREASK